MEILTPVQPTRDAAYHSTAAKLKNSFALIILLLGLFAGSLFVDIGQLITGSGFSGSALREQTVLESKGKTWVAYTEPAITVRVISDAECAACDPSEALLWMRRILPTLSAVKVAADSFEGRELIAKHHIKGLPAFVFDTGIEHTDFYTEATPLFTEQDGRYFFDMNKIGLPVGKYVEAPAAEANDIRFGKSDAAVIVTVFSDFACTHCQEYFTTLKEVAEAYTDRVGFVFKHFPLPNHPTAATAALAASCADAQGQFFPYANLLFARQTDWNKQPNRSVQSFKNYAWQIKGMNGREFAACLDEQRFQSTIAADTSLAEQYSLGATPATFVGTEFISGAAPKAELQKLIDNALTAAQE